MIGDFFYDESERKQRRLDRDTNRRHRQRQLDAYWKYKQAEEGKATFLQNHQISPLTIPTSQQHKLYCLPVNQQTWIAPTPSILLSSLNFPLHLMNSSTQLHQFTENTDCAAPMPIRHFNEARYPAL